MPMPIEIAINTSNYDKRLCWMLSSLLEQSSMDYTIMMSYMGGSPTEKVIDCFKEAGLPFSQMLVQPDRNAILDRGHRRSEMMRLTRQPWIMFTDSDVVYPPNFMQKLNELVTGKYAGSTCCLAGGRYATELADMEPLVATYAYPCVVKRAYDEVSRRSLTRLKNVGAGFCHIANVQAALAKAGGYMPEGVGMDYLNRKGQYRTKSDKWFRKTMGRQLLRPRELPLQIHIQHRRDNYAVSDN